MITSHITPSHAAFMLGAAILTAQCLIQHSVGYMMSCHSWITFLLCPKSSFWRPLMVFLLVQDIFDKNKTINIIKLDSYSIPAGHHWDFSLYLPNPT